MFVRWGVGVENPSKMYGRLESQMLVARITCRGVTRGYKFIGGRS